MQNKTQPILKLSEIYKNFGVVKALKGINLQCYEGKCMGVLGENGAGKSTLMNIISGVHKKSFGKIFYKGKEFDPKNVKFASKNGIVIVHQELVNFKEMNILDNIFLGDEIISPFRSINYKKQTEKILKIFLKLGISLNLKSKISELSVAEQQMVEIAKAVFKNADVIIMDEPTSSLSNKETEKLFKVIKQLKSENKAIIYISHKLEEIPLICDDVTIIRDGEYIGQWEISQINENEIIKHMVGRTITQRYPEKINSNKVKKIFEVKNLSGQLLNNINFHINQGEILGFAGLVGAQRTELFKSIIGEYKTYIKEIYLDDQIISLNSPSNAIKNGFYYVTEDRKMEGLFLEFSIKYNLSISSLKYCKNKYSFSNSFKKEYEITKKMFDKTLVKSPNLEYKTKLLSGGNQQKILLGKAFLSRPRIIVLDEPTRGVDIAARKDIYNIIISMIKEENIAVVIISSDLPEIIGLCNRVIVMKKGTIVKELQENELSQESIIKYAL